MLVNQSFVIDTNEAEVTGDLSVKIESEDVISTIKTSPKDTVETLRELAPSLQYGDFKLDDRGALIIRNEEFAAYIKSRRESISAATTACNNCQCQIQNNNCPSSRSFTLTRDTFKD